MRLSLKLAATLVTVNKWMRGLRMGRSAPHPVTLEPERPRAASESVWTAERLRVHIRRRMPDSKLFVLSNREPYSHVHRGKRIEVVVPPSGLVTAIEPILRACDGVWIAHGSGDADVETTGRRDSLRVPPENPQYTLRRVWLTKEEECGYYGFANEGLWPLCHIAHTRPAFRSSDWQQYREVNEKFARVLLEEMADTEEPGVLI
jgi:trehalose 6-phosphate synthase